MLVSNTDTCQIPDTPSSLTHKHEIDILTSIIILKKLLNVTTCVTVVLVSNIGTCLTPDTPSRFTTYTNLTR